MENSVVLLPQFHHMDCRSATRSLSYVCGPCLRSKVTLFPIGDERILSNGHHTFSIESVLTKFHNDQ